MWTEIQNRILNQRYKAHPKAAIVSCFFNPQNSPYRQKVFDTFYKSIKHLPHMIAEGVFENDQSRLPKSKSIVPFYIQDLLWHKETLLNKAIALLPKHIEYVFWVDADVLFANHDWIVEGVEALQSANIVQPFEYCVHLEKDEIEPSFKLGPVLKSNCPNDLNSRVWRSFCSNVVKHRELAEDTNYNNHGHVGFAWGARREVLEAVPLYDRALIGGADHIMAHAVVGQFNHPCIVKSFTKELDFIEDWSCQFYAKTQGKVGFVKGALYHLWHGDIEKRNYLRRIQDFTSMVQGVKQRDTQGFYRAPNAQAQEYYRSHLRDREVTIETDADQENWIEPIISMDLMGAPDTSGEEQELIECDNPPAEDQQELCFDQSEMFS